MRRTFALAFVVTAVIAITGCSGRSDTPQPGLSPLAVATNECQPQATTSANSLHLTPELIASALDIQPAAKIYPPPTSWDGTVSGMSNYGLDVFHSVCDMVSDVFERGKLGGTWSVELVMATAGQTIENCASPRAPLSTTPVICNTRQISPGYYFGRVLVYPYEVIQALLHDRGVVDASGSLVYGLMETVLDATLRGAPDSTTAVCAAGVWQGTLIAEGLRTPDTTNAFVDGVSKPGTSDPEAANYGIANRSIGKCIRKYQHFAANGGSPSAGTLPQRLRRCHFF